MIQIQQIKLHIPHEQDALFHKVCKLLRVNRQEICSFEITRRSLDARKKPDLFYVYTVEVTVNNEAKIKKRIKNQNIKFQKKPAPYRFIPSGTKEIESRPVVIGTGPAGLFCGYQLAKLGYRPILLERGADVDQRFSDVSNFWNHGKLDPNSNVQFGEGGAGTFSDGKLNTLVHDASGRNREVLKTFVQFGAPEHILYDSKPHIGTDVLAKIVKNMRTEIIRLGGEVRFHSLVCDFLYEDRDGERRITGICVKDTEKDESYHLPVSVVVLAIGHSARDTFAKLKEKDFMMRAKSFAVGVRVEHSQEFINQSQYGKEYPVSLPAAAYKLTAKTADGRGVYTFCMCPGGYVVNASSEEHALAINGMSYSERDGEHANSAVIVTVTPDDFDGEDVLAGVEFQRKLEHAAYREGNGNIPVQYFADYCADRISMEDKQYLPQMKGPYTWANVRHIFPGQIGDDLMEGLQLFDKKIPGYADEHMILSGVESRTSSPIRIERDETFQSNIRGVYPCGEGAGYAGGITSAAMDGLKVAEEIARVWKPF